MINFKEELAKYRFVPGIDDVEGAVRSDETKDIMELLQHIAVQTRRGEVHVPQSAVQEAAQSVHNESPEMNEAKEPVKTTSQNTRKRTGE